MRSIRTCAVVPAHNEQDCIAATLQSLLKQGLDPADILVICDNCTDNTQQIAESTGVRVRCTIANRHKKAGALNQALRELLPQLSDSDSVLVMDADSVLDPGFVSNARFRLAYDPHLGGVSGTFRGGPGGGYVGMLQRNEYARYARDVRRLRGRALVLTGTAAIFRVAALRDVIAGRQDGRLPIGGEVMPQSSEPNVYDEKVLTEDNLSSSRWRCCISAGGSSRREPARSPRRSCQRGGRSRTNDCGGSEGRSRTSRTTG